MMKQVGDCRINRILKILLLCGLSGCQPDAPPEPEGQESLAWSGKVFALLAEDLNGDGLKELVAVDHGGNTARLFAQSSPREFETEADYTGVGKHPGNLMRWPKDPARLLLAAEGDGAIRSLLPDREQGFRVESNLEESSPRYVSLFHWPQWGEGVAISPYANDFIVLLKHYDPAQGKAEQRVVVPLSNSRAKSVRAADRITAADLDGDGADELLFAFSFNKEVFQVSLTGADSDQAPKLSLLFENPNWGAPNEVHAVDLDSDGDQDLLLPDEISPGLINVLLNDGKGKMTEGKSFEFPYPDGITEMKVGRDKDGSTYLLAVGYGAVALYQIPQGWQDGMPIPRRHIEWPEGGLSRDMQFKDVDGDGWLDGVVGKLKGDHSVWVVYGPLWDRFQSLADQGFVLK